MIILADKTYKFEGPEFSIELSRTQDGLVHGWVRFDTKDKYNLKATTIIQEGLETHNEHDSNNYPV